MNDGPPAKRSDTQSPFAVLSPEVVRGQTGTRVKITDSGPTDALQDQPVTTSVPPESLKKPFSSLTPKKPTPSLTPAPPPAGAAPPPPPSQLFAETASIRPPSASSGGGRATATSSAGRPAATKRDATSASSRYGTCKEHGTALTSEGKCVLCAREKAKRDAKSTSRLLIVFAVLLLSAVAYVVFSVMPN
jgi:hypothetical protein